MFELSEYPFGRIRSLEELQIIHACTELYTAFTDLTDAGELEKVADLHTDDIEVYQRGRAEPWVGRVAWIARLKQVRFSYPGRRVLHTPSNIRFHSVTPERAECRAVTALYDLVLNPEGRGIARYSSELVGYAAEEALFVPVNGLWRFRIRKVTFLAGAKRLPIGVLPGELNWEDTGDNKK